MFTERTHPHEDAHCKTQLSVGWGTSVRSHRSCSNICFLASVFGCNGLKMFEGDCTRPVCETALTRCCLIHHGITSPFTDFSGKWFRLTVLHIMSVCLHYIYINIYVYICIYTHYTTMQCSTIPYTTLHYITYIHVFIFTHVCHLTTKPTVQRTKPRQTKKWRQAKARQKHCSYQGSNFCSSAPTQILPFLPFLQLCTHTTFRHIEADHSIS